MSSLLTNTSAMTALAALTQTQQNLKTAENQVSTGMRISSAADNAALLVDRDEDEIQYRRARRRQ